MNYRKFGHTDLTVSEVGFGGWAIGGPAEVGGVAIGWGDADDALSEQALHRATERGITFFDTADFYGLGHSEELIGRSFGNRPDVVIATKVGQKEQAGKITIDYSKEYVRTACEDSLRRLRRDSIDFYQLHVAKVGHLEQGDCLEALTELQQAGKIRYWGISLNTFAPEPEADFFLNNHSGNGLGNGFQVVFNVLNQYIRPYLSTMHARGYGLIARMPLQFGLLSGKFSAATTFSPTDHRHYRLTAPIIEATNGALQPVWALCEKYAVSPAELSLSYILSHPEISTVIPGIRTPAQAEQNTRRIVRLDAEDVAFITGLYETDFKPLLASMRKQE